MTENTDRISKLLSEKRIKLHLFTPSQRKIWTIVGKNEEHWISPEEKFCSCKSYYFGNLEKPYNCYHLNATFLAQKSGEYDTIQFSDEEFPQFVKGLISEMSEGLT